MLEELLYGLRYISAGRMVSEELKILLFLMYVDGGF